MAQNILVIDGHPDPDRARLSHALAAAYSHGAAESGAQVRRIALSGWQGAFLRSPSEFGVAPDDPFVIEARAAFEWAEHIVFVFPLWLGAAPALLRALLEQVSRAGFALEAGPKGPRGRLKGRSARLIVTMGMPAFAYRLMFGAHGVRAIAQSILGLAGVAPVRLTFWGMIEAKGAGARRITEARTLGQQRR